MKHYTYYMTIFILFFIITGCAKEEEKVKIRFQAVQDATPATQTIIDGYNASQETYQVEWVALSPDNRQGFEQVMTALDEGNRDLDVYSVDVTWLGDLADKNYILPLNTYMKESEVEHADYSPGILHAGQYKNSQYGLPYYQNVGLLYYRSDIVQDMEAKVLESGNYMFSDLVKVAKRHMGEKGTKTGFVFQSDAYEGLTANVSEFTNSLHNIRQGLEALKLFVDSAVTPEDIMNYQETETHNAFVDGKAVLSRNWSYQYSLIKSEDTFISMDQVGIAPLPYGGVVGGNLLVINRHTNHPEGAWDFIQYASGLEGQGVLLEEGYIPTRVTFMQGADHEEIPEGSILQYETVRRALMTSITRPVSPSYAQMSEVIQVSVHKYLVGINTINKTIYELNQLVKDYHVVTKDITKASEIGGREGYEE